MENNSERWNKRIYEEYHQGVQLADLKEATYHNALLVAALIDLLVDKGLCTRQEISETAQLLDTELSFDI